MKKAYFYAREKLFDAVYSLVVGQKDVRSRLVNAYMQCHTLKAEHFPDELKKDWTWIQRELAKHGHVRNYKGEIQTGSVENTMNTIKNKTGSKIARKIFDLYCELSEHTF